MHHRGRIADAHLDVVGNDRAELGEHGPRLDHGVRPVRLVLVPVGRQPEHRPRIVGAERADDGVVRLGCVLQHDQPGVVVEADAEFLAGGAAIGGFDPALRP